MLFNTFSFIFFFLPITLIGFYLLGHFKKYKASLSWLVGASLVFYGWWNPAYLGLILLSILFNYAIGWVLRNNKSSNSPKAKGVLVFGVVANLALLGYFKYANFFISNLNWAFSTEFRLENIALPLAISFFTFQQVAYLADTYKGGKQGGNFIQYCLFVVFFPQLIAGPIVHHKEITPQFLKTNIYKLSCKKFAIGLSLFSIGLFKKVFFADNIAKYANRLFDAANYGGELGFFDAWLGVFLYSFQIYFDFSGYSDMAIGIALLFGISLPINFDSPYKSTSIIDFWHRWHITLSRFMRDYLYIPLGGNKKGNGSHFTNLMITMFLGGLWHGANWTFIVWGVVHGMFLTINHIWLMSKKIISYDSHMLFRYRKVFSTTLTFFAVSIAWVFFRSQDFNVAGKVFKAMFGLSLLKNQVLSSDIASSNYTSLINTFRELGIYMRIHDLMLSEFSLAVCWLASSLFVVFALPNCNQIRLRIETKYTLKFAIFIGIILFFSLTEFITETPSKFIYFQF